MSQVQSVFYTISCDSPKCTKSVTFSATEEGSRDAVKDNPWMRSFRNVSTQDKRGLGYCSDECEAEGLKTGAHNILEPKKIVEPGGAAGVNLAAKAAEQAAAATAALKTGAGITLG